MLCNDQSLHVSEDIATSECTGCVRGGGQTDVHNNCVLHRDIQQFKLHVGGGWGGGGVGHTLSILPASTTS